MIQTLARLYIYSWLVTFWNPPTKNTIESTPDSHVPWFSSVSLQDVPWFSAEQHGCHCVGPEFTVAWTKDKGPSWINPSGQRSKNWGDFWEWSSTQLYSKRYNFVQGDCVYMYIEREIIFIAIWTIINNGMMWQYPRAMNFNMFQYSKLVQSWMMWWYPGFDDHRFHHPSLNHQ